MSETNLRAPFPWWGGKSKVADVVWRAFGDVPNYVEPFLGSAAVLLGRPSPPRIETVNDADGDVVNFWRAVRADPGAVAEVARYPVFEVDLHARHLALVETAAAHVERMMREPRYYDVERAGWWVWGLSMWIGSGWCSGRPSRKVPRLRNGGQGVHARFIPKRAPPELHGARRGVVGSDDLRDWFSALADRFRRVRVCCGDWKRVLGNSVVGATRTRDTGMTPCAIFLDPPYSGEYESNTYAVRSEGVASAARDWAVAHGSDPDLRIALCGYDGDYEMPPGWSVYAWKQHRGYATAEEKNVARERVWFSPACLPFDKQQDLFEAR